jgi:hypothetical protein
MSFRVTPRLAVALLLSALLFGCDGRTPLEVPDTSRQSGNELVSPQQIQVPIHAVFSGPPNREPGQISLDDPSVFVQILGIEQYLPRPASPNDVRIGETWETGTPAEDFIIVDIDNDGILDIQLRWSTQQLINNGHLGPDTELIVVWGRDPSTGELYRGQEHVTILPPPVAMEELVVVNDGNFFFDANLDFAGAGNAQFVRNVVNFENDGPRSDGTVVWWDRGRNSATTTTPVRAQQVIAAEGFTVQIVESHIGDLFLNIPLNVRSIWLWTPRIEFTDAEVNALKQFVVEGGRIMFIGENGGFYGTIGLAVMNNFLIRMGVSIRNVGGSTGVGNTSTTNIAPHPLMAGITLLRYAGAGILELGPEGNIMFWDAPGTNVVGATEPIDPTPLTGREVFPPFRGPYLPVEPGLSEAGQ